MTSYSVFGIISFSGEQYPLGESTPSTNNNKAFPSGLISSLRMSTSEGAHTARRRLEPRLRHHNWRAPPSPGGNPQTNGNNEVAEEEYIPASCLPIIVTTDIAIALPDASTVLVPQTVTYTPTCVVTSRLLIPTDTGTNKNPSDNEDSGSSDIPASTLRDPFYASTIPMAYSIAMTITLSYVLLFLLFLSTPRPWLQKVATLTVVICLTLALTETTRLLAEEYAVQGETWAADTESGSAKQIREKVVEGTEMRVGRIISDTFLWLAQVQTLIRLFPRHREKIVIKWAGFALIVLDTIFAILVQFVAGTTFMSPESFLDTIPAMSYLFQIALSLLYASCVVYYSLSSRIRRFAYYHSNAPSNIIIAILSLTAVLIPMVFFCLDIGQKDLAAWGDYVRWVGAAAASVVVWEWVDRIERLEREERREGVLGREVFDGDDGLVEDMGISEEDDDRGNGKGSGVDSSQGGSGGGGRGREQTAGAMALGALPDHLDPATTIVNQQSRNLVASYQCGGNGSGSQTSCPSVVSTVYAARRSVVGDSYCTVQPLQHSGTNSRSSSAVHEDGSDVGGRRSAISFAGVRTDRRTTISSSSERSTPDSVNNRAIVLDGDGTDHSEPRSGTVENNERSEKDGTVVNASAQGTPSVEKQDEGATRENVVREKVNEALLALNPFKRKQASSPPCPPADSIRSRLISYLPNLPFSIPFIKTSSHTVSATDSRKNVRIPDIGTGKRALPVTVIPAPPRGRGISLRELEEARRSGVGDENVQGVGLWTGGSIRNGDIYQQGSTPLPENQNGQRFSNSPGYGDTHEQPASHQHGWDVHQYQDSRQPYEHQQHAIQRSTSFSQVQTPSLPPLTPSPAVTATSSWAGSQYHYPQQQHQQHTFYPKSSTTSPPASAIASGFQSQSNATGGLGSGNTPSSSPILPVMSGALPYPPSETTGLPIVPMPSPSSVTVSRQGNSSGGPGAGRSRGSTSCGNPDGLEVVEEVVKGPEGSEGVGGDAENTGCDELHSASQYPAKNLT